MIVPAVAATVVYCIDTGLLMLLEKMQRSKLLPFFCTKLQLAPAKGLVMVALESIGGIKLSMTTLKTVPLGVSVMFQVTVAPCSMPAA
jgi:hypothetical protein